MRVQLDTGRFYTNPIPAQSINNNPKTIAISLSLDQTSSIPIVQKQKNVHRHCLFVSLARSLAHTDSLTGAASAPSSCDNQLCFLAAKQQVCSQLTTTRPANLRRLSHSCLRPFGDCDVVLFTLPFVLPATNADGSEPASPGPTWLRRLYLVLHLLSFFELGRS